jgi:hypothetical protein
MSAFLFSVYVVFPAFEELRPFCRKSRQTWREFRPGFDFVLHRRPAMPEKSNDFVRRAKTMFLKRFDTVSSRVQASAASLYSEAIFF